MLSAPAANMVRAKVPQESQESCEQGGGVGRSPKKPAARSVMGSGVSLQEGLGTNDALGLHIALFLYVRLLLLKQAIVGCSCLWAEAESVRWLWCGRGGKCVGWAPLAVTGGAC